MNLHCKHIYLTVLLFFTTVICFAGTSHTKVQKLHQQNTTAIPVLLVEFEDVKFSLEDPVTEFNALFNGIGYSRNGSQGSVAEYFNTNFQGTRTFEFPIIAKISLDSPISRYGAPSSTFNDTDVKQLLKDACHQAVQDGTDFTMFASNDSGTIENIAIIFAGYSESEGGDKNSIWAHRQNLSNEDILIGELKVLSYTCTAELKGNSGTTISPIGTICHELCHFLGLPDIYDTNGETEGLSLALHGTLSIMDKGNHSNNGNTPPYFNSIERELLGIGEIEDLLPDKSYTLDPVNLSGKIYRINGSVEGEYFLLECRIAQGWDRFIGGNGLVIYHIDKSDIEYGGISSVQRWEFNNINSYAQHPCARVLAAAETGQSNGALFYPGSSNITSVSFNTGHMPLKDWHGEPVGIAIKDIVMSNGKVSFNTVPDYLYDNSLPRAIECRGTAYQQDARIEWTDLPAPKERDENARWLVKWSNKGGTHSGTVLTDTCTIYINNLQPGEEYNFEVRYTNEWRIGAKAVLNLRTHPITSSFPFIFIDKDIYHTGEKMDLRLFNLQEYPSNVSWYINGNKLNNTTVTFDNSGETEIQATIKYNDGSEEKIYKRIIIE